MAAAETAKLIASLSLKDGLTPVVKTVGTSLDRLDTRLTKSQSRISRIGAGLGTALKAGAVVGIGALGGLAALSISLAKEGQDAAKVQTVFAKAVANSGKVTAAQVKVLEAQQDALLGLSGIDDEVIKAEQTRLIQMGFTGDKVAQLTALSLDLAKATGKDLSAATVAVGKAAQGSNTALQRLGIILPKDADAVAELNRRFGGTTKALSGGLDVRLNVLRERLANVREEAGIKLLPAMTKIVDVVGRKLVPAFGGFVDRILPVAIDGIDKLAGLLEGGAAGETVDRILATVKDLAPAVQQSAEITGKVITTAVGAFKSLPPEIQALAIAGFTVNKLTGGLVTNIAGGLISAVISSFRGLMNVNAAVVNVNGPVTGPGGGSLPDVLPKVGGAALGAAALPVAGLAAATAGLVIAGIAVDNATDPQHIRNLRGQAATARARGISDANNKPLQQLRAIEEVNDRQLDAVKRVAAVDDRSYDAIEHLRTTSSAANSQILAELKRQRNIRPVVKVAATVATTVQSIINGRLVNANLSRYTTVVGGQVVNATSQSGV